MSILVSIDERKQIAKSEFVEFGKKLKFKVIDIDKVAERIMKERKESGLSTYIEIQPISEDNHKVPNRVSTFQKDPKTSVYYGIAIGEDEYGNIKWQKIPIGDSLSLNLENESDAKIWAVIRFNPDIEGSPFQKSNPYYKIYDPVESARVRMAESNSIKLAFDRIDKIDQDAKAMVNFCRYLSIDLMPNSTYDIVIGELLNYARNYPFDFNKKWDNKHRAVIEMFESARSLGIIIKDLDKGFMFNGIQLGIDKLEAVKYINRENSVSSSISSKINSMDTVVDSVSKTIKKKNPQFEE
jgi:hypothetical protein